MRNIGASLAQSLYDTPVDIYLQGELGAGKTTFLQGFAAGLGIEGHLTSPTYALEQRYSYSGPGALLRSFGASDGQAGPGSGPGPDEDVFVHIDLYRLSDKDASDFIEHASDDFSIRCIEWSEKAKVETEAEGIHVHISEKSHSSSNSNSTPHSLGDSPRTVYITFNDITLPSRNDILQWRKEMMLPSHICDHCDAVAMLCDELAGELIEKGIIVRREALKRAAELHDLLRFVDFHTGESHMGHSTTPTAEQTWNEIKETYTGQRHEQACASFLIKKGCSAVAEIVRYHGLRLPPPSCYTIEQKILYYADKRLINDRRVTVEERFADFQERYSGTDHEKDGGIWYSQVKEVEKELKLAV